MLMQSQASQQQTGLHQPVQGQRGSQVWDDSFKPGIVFYLLPCMIKFACHLVTSRLRSFSSWLREPSTVELCVRGGTFSLGVCSLVA